MSHASIVDTIEVGVAESNGVNIGEKIEQWKKLEELRREIEVRQEELRSYFLQNVVGVISTNGVQVQVRNGQGKYEVDEQAFAKLYPEHMISVPDPAKVKELKKEFQEAQGDEKLGIPIIYKKSDKKIVVCKLLEAK